MKLKTTIIGFVLALAACGNEGPDLSEQQLRAVGFGSYTEQFQTRSSDVQRAIPDGGSMGVYAYYHDGSTWAADVNALSLDASANKLLPDFMWNQQCTYSADLDAFVYTPLKYWPNEESDKLSFIAYYPYTAESPGNPESPASPAQTGLTPLLTNSGKGLPRFNFTVKDNAEDQVDLLVSDLIIDLPQTRDTEDDPGTPFNDLSIYDKVKFLFHHALAKVEFRIVADADIRKDIVEFRLSKLEITHINKTGTLTTSYDAGTSATSLGWSGQSNKHPYPFKTYVPQLLMPQPLDDEAMLDLSYSITFKSDGTSYHYYGSQEGEGGTVTGTLVADEEYTYNNQATLQLNEMKQTGTNTPLTEWLPNHHYIYTIRLRANRIEFTGEVVDWGEYKTPPDIKIEE